MTSSSPILDKLDDFEYHEIVGKGNEYEGFYNRNPRPPYPTDCDEPPFTSPEEDLDNGTFEDYPTALIFKFEDEGIYDRNPYTGIKGFDFTWEALAPAAILNGVCISWVFDPTLDNGTLEESIHRQHPPLDPLGEEWLYSEGPWATANAGEYDSDPAPCFEDGFSTVDAPCMDNTTWCGYDDGEFDQTDEYCECETFEQLDPDPDVCYIDPCIEPDLDCDADGGIATVYGPPNYEEDCECEVDCCLVDNDEIPPPPPYTGPNLINGEIYDRYCEPMLNPPPEIELCPVPPLYVSLEEVNENITLSMLPSVRNAYTPLRLWKNHTLMVTDEVPTVEGNDEYRNFLCADWNRGPEPEASYRHYVRLPMEYTREGKEWSRAAQVCSNQSYFSSSGELTDTLFAKEDAKPTVYYGEYNNRELNPGIAIYEEGYHHSSNREDTLEMYGSGFDDSAIGVEEIKPIPYAYGGITDYDELETRLPTEDGEWRGKYYTRGPGRTLSGHLSTDLKTGALIDTGYTPVYDESQVKRPDTTFADEFPQVKMKNYVVSYAYFMADMSASEEPVFEPTMAHCWRNPLIDNDVEVDGECVFKPMHSNTAYLLHPTTLDYGKRTRNPRPAGELTAQAETQEGFFGVRS